MSSRPNASSARLGKRNRDSGDRDGDPEHTGDGCSVESDEEDDRQRHRQTHSQAPHQQQANISSFFPHVGLSGAKKAHGHAGVSARSISATNTRETPQKMAAANGSRVAISPSPDTTTVVSSNAARQPDKTDKIVKPNQRKSAIPSSSSSSSYTQLYLDCGQSKFGQILCDKCGILYMPGIQEDEKQHRQHCEMVLWGVPCHSIRSSSKGSNINSSSATAGATATTTPMVKGGTLVVRQGFGSTGGGATVEKQRRTAASFFLPTSKTITPTTSTNSKAFTKCSHPQTTVVSWKPPARSKHTKKSKSDRADMGGSNRAGSDRTDNSNSTNNNLGLPAQWPLLARLISRDLGMEESNVLRHLSQDHVFLYIQSGGSGSGNGNANVQRTVSRPPGKTARILGVITVQIITEAYRMISSSLATGDSHATASDAAVAANINSDRSQTPEKAMLGIALLWTHSSARQQGVATHLVDAARQHAIFGMNVPRSYLAFSSPTHAGFAFARRYVFGGSGGNRISCHQVDGSSEGQKSSCSDRTTRREPHTPWTGDGSPRGLLVYEL